MSSVPSVAPTSGLMRSQRFSTLLKEVADQIETMVNEVEETTEDDPVVLPHQARCHMATLTYCADNLSRMEETLRHEASPDARGSIFGTPVAPLKEEAPLHSFTDALGSYGSHQNAATSPLHDTKRAETLPLLGSVRSLTSPLPSLFNIFRLQKEGHRPRPVFTRKMIHWMAVCSMLWQIFQIFLLMIMGAAMKHTSESSSPWVKVSVAIVCIFQVVHVGVTVAIMYKIGMQIAHHTITIEILLQSYISTVMAMAGVYFLFMVIDTSSFVGFEAKWADATPKDIINTTPENQWELFLHMLYLSSTIMTGCGFGDITPRAWYSVIAVVFQQLMSVTYSTIIFGLALQHFTSRIHVRKKALQRKQEEEAEARRVENDPNGVLNERPLLTSFTTK